MEIPAIGRSLLVLARIVGLAAAFLTVVGYTVIVFSAPEILPVAMWNFSFALLATWGLLKARPSLLFLAFLCSLAIAGWYTFLVDGLPKWIGVGNVLYLISGALVMTSCRCAQPRYREAETERRLS